MKSIAITTGASVFTPQSLYSKAEVDSNIEIDCQQYTWFSYFNREDKSWMKNPDKCFQSFLETGFRGYEPSFNNPSEVGNLKSNLDSYKIGTKSMYVNSVLHEPQLVEKNIADILAIAREAKKIGIEILVTNPTPLAWNGSENKSDEQLKAQAIALNLLGKELKSLGIKLAYHNHDAEMRESASEFHHMLTGTDPGYVHLCLDAHWIYRGAGNSQIALFDIVELYANRIVEVHLRQSQKGIWSEVFGEGDIDYRRLAKVLMQHKLRPHLVLEQAVEAGTPHTMETVEALRRSLANAQKVFDGCC